MHLANLLLLILASAAAWPAGPASAMPVPREMPARRAMLPRRAVVFTTETEETGRPCASAVLDVLSHYKVGRMVFRGPFDGPVPLRGVDGRPLFALVVVCGAQGGLFSADQRAQLAQYQREFAIRRVSFGADPDEEAGLRSAAAGDAKTCCEAGVEQLIRWYPPEAVAVADVHLESISAKPDPISSVGHVHTPAVLLDRGIATPVLSFDTLPDRFPYVTVAAAVVRDHDAESLLFFFDLTLDDAAVRVGELWIQWGLRTTKFIGYTSYGSRVLDQNAAN